MSLVYPTHIIIISTYSIGWWKVPSSFQWIWSALMETSRTVRLPLKLQKPKNMTRLFEGTQSTWLGVWKLSNNPSGAHNAKKLFSVLLSQNPSFCFSVGFLYFSAYDIVCKPCSFLHNNWIASTAPKK